MFTSALHNITIVNFSKSSSYLESFFRDIQKERRKTCSMLKTPFRAKLWDLVHKGGNQATPSHLPAGNSKRQSTRTACPVLVLVARIRPSSMMTSASRGHQLPGPSCIMRHMTYWAHGGVTASQVLSQLWFCPRQMASVMPMIQVEIWKMPNTSSII